MKTIAIILSGIWIPYLISTSYAQSPWKQLTDMPGSRAGHTSCTLNDRIYVFGGVSTIFGSSLKSLQVYDPIMDTWTSKADMITARASFHACAANSKIYAIGGAKDLFFSAIGTIEKYDPASDTWTYETDMPRARLGHTASLVDGKIYIIGGAIGHYTCYPEVDVYDTLTKTWTTVSDFPTPRMNLSGVVLNGKIYTLGGMLGLTEGEIGKTIVEEYDPATDTWTRKAGMIRRRKFTSACVLNDKIYVFGGAQDYCEGVLSSVEEYDPATDMWREITVMPSISVLLSVTQMNEKAYISGGASVDCATDVDQTMYEYNPHPTDIIDIINPVTKVYPNPTYEMLNIEISNLGSQGTEINILDITGKIVYQKKYNNAYTNSVEQVDLSGYAIGIYLLKVKKANSVFVGKVVVR